MRHLSQKQAYRKELFALNLPKDKLEDLLYMAFFDMVTNVDKKSYIPSFNLDSNIRKISNILTSPSPKHSILITGDCGIGKTTMLNAIKIVLQFLANNSSTYFPYGYDLVSDIPLISAKQLAKRILKDDKEFISYPILMIDDLGHEPVEIINYGVKETPIVDLFEERYSRKWVTIISSNLTPSEIASRYGNRVADRFEEIMNVVEIKEESFRIR